jgi:hypothetical protein
VGGYLGRVRLLLLLLLLLLQLLEPRGPDCSQFVVRHSTLRQRWLVGWLVGWLAGALASRRMDGDDQSGPFSVPIPTVGGTGGITGGRIRADPLNCPIGTS